VVIKKGSVEKSWLLSEVEKVRLKKSWLLSEVEKVRLKKSWLLSEVEKVRLKKSLFELVVVENWVEFWRWQSKVSEKKWQEMNQTVETRIHV
jgi:hypothetical protein